MEIKKAVVLEPDMKSIIPAIPDLLPLAEKKGFKGILAQIEKKHMKNTRL